MPQRRQGRGRVAPSRQPHGVAPRQLARPVAPRLAALRRSLEGRAHGLRSVENRGRGQALRVPPLRFGHAPRRRILLVARLRAAARALVVLARPRVLRHAALRPRAVGVWQGHRRRSHSRFRRMPLQGPRLHVGGSHI